MLTVKLRDKLANHVDDFFKNTSNIIYDKSSVEPNDIVIYTSENFDEFYPDAKLNIALLMESVEIEKDANNYIANNIDKYDIIYTFSKKLLDLKRDNIKLNLYGTTWLHETYREIFKKGKICSIIASNKLWLVGHQLRHTIIDNLIATNNTNVDLFGSRFNNLPQSTEPNPKSLSNGKILALKDYMFSIAIENCKIDYYFTEKLIDCFLSGTVPIYYGCPSIEKFFNTKGILIFDTIEECIDIVNTLSIEKYNEMLPYVKQNFEIAKNFADFKIDEAPILEKLNI